VSRICEEFGCLPDAAREAIDDDLNGSIFTLIDMRGLAATKSRIDNAEKGKVPTDRSAQRYLRLHMEAVGRELGIKTA